MVDAPFSRERVSTQKEAPERDRRRIVEIPRKALRAVPCGSQMKTRELQDDIATERFYLRDSQFPAASAPSFPTKTFPQAVKFQEWPRIKTYMPRPIRFPNLFSGSKDVSAIISNKDKCHLIIESLQELRSSVIRKKLGASVAFTQCVGIAKMMANYSETRIHRPLFPHHRQITIWNSA